MTFNIREEEWKALRNECKNHVDETRRIEKLTVGAAGAVYAWLATHPTQIESFGWYVWIVPMLFSVLGALRSWALGKEIQVTADYLLLLENKFTDECKTELGWEKFFAPRRGDLYRAVVVFWFVFISVTILVPLVVLIIENK